MSQSKTNQPGVVAALAIGGGIALSGGLSPGGMNARHVDEFKPASVIPLVAEDPPRLIVDAPVPQSLSVGRVVVRYRTENIRIMPVYGSAALSVSPRIGHLHITVDDSPWHWLDASGEPITLNGFTPGPHKILVQLADPVHTVVDSATVQFIIPDKAASHVEPRAMGN